MRQADGLGQSLIQAQGAGNGARDLRDFHGVGQAGAIQITLVIDEHLGFVDQPAEGVGMNDAIPVALVFAAEPGWGFSEASTAGLGFRRRVRGQCGGLAYSAGHGQPK